MPTEARQKKVNWQLNRTETDHGQLVDFRLVSLYRLVSIAGGEQTELLIWLVGGVKTAPAEPCTALSYTPPSRKRTSTRKSFTTTI